MHVSNIKEETETATDCMLHNVLKRDDNCTFLITFVTCVKIDFTTLEHQVSRGVDVES